MDPEYAGSGTGLGGREVAPSRVVVGLAASFRFPRSAWTYVRAPRTSFSYFPSVPRAVNRQQPSFSSFCPCLSPFSLPFSLSLSRARVLRRSPAPPSSIRRLAFGIPFLIPGHTEELLPRTRRGPPVMTATLQCTWRPKPHNRWRRTRRTRLAGVFASVALATFHPRGSVAIVRPDRGERLSRDNQQYRR